MTTKDLGSLDLDQLSKHTADELLEDMLPSIEREEATSYNDLYIRWEKQHWLVSELDFTQDKKDFAALHEALRFQISGTFGAFYQGEQSVTYNLAPLVLAAPRIDHEIFLTTQIVDEARHLVFFRRVFNEVVGIDGDTAFHLAHIRPKLTRWYNDLFFGPQGLDGRADDLRLNPSDVGKFAELITLYHLIVEAGLALLGQRFLLDLCRSLQIMPGFYKGFMAVTRDESRHVGFGVRVLRELCQSDPSISPRIMGVVNTALPALVRFAFPPEEELDPRLLDVMPPGFQFSPQERHRYSMTHVLKRLSAVGFSTDEVNDLGKRGWTEFNSTIDEWEHRRDGAVHYARMFEEPQAVGAARI